MSKSGKRALIITIVVLALLGLFFIGAITTAVLLGGNIGLKSKVAVINVDGEIVVASGTGWQQDTAANDRRLIYEIRQADKDVDVGAIVLRVNSPGGSVVASEEIYQALTEVKKPVVVYMSELAASGGYYISCAADEIVANPATLTGSIGVVSQFINAETLLKKVGVDIEFIKSGAEKDMGSYTRPLTEEEKAYWQTIIDESYQHFVDIVADGRHLPRQDVLSLADGRVYSGQKALELGLVDKLGTWDDALKDAAELAGIRGEPQIKEYGPAPSVFSNLLSMAFPGTGISGISLNSDSGLKYLYQP